MKKQEYLKCIDELNLDKTKYCIIAGGVMLMHGLKVETEDIDIKVSPEYFRELSQRYGMKKSSKYFYLYEMSDNIEVAVLDFLAEDVKFIDGYPVFKLQKELEWKIANNRPKDQEAIKVIKEYLDNKNKNI